MKKLFISLVALATAATMSAANSRFAQISVSSVGGGDDVVYIAENSDYSPAAENGVDIPKILNNMQAYNVNLYVVSENAKYGMFGTNDLADVEIAFQSNANESEYTLSFAYITGEITLFDTEANVSVTLANGETYNFTQAAGTTNAARFIINQSAPAAPKICHEGQLLKVTNYNGIVKVDDNEYQVAGNLDIDIANLSAGHHTVNFDGQNLIINVR